MKSQELLTTPVVRALQAHAVRCYPRECTGAIVAGEYVPLENKAASPTLFSSPGREVLEQLRETRELQALCHSHPDGPNCPSGQDMRVQMAQGLPCVIVTTDGAGCLHPFAWGDQLEPPPLVGRGFMHGVTDCYSLIRDYFRLEHNTVIPEYARDWEWWNKKDLYTDNFERAGFHAIEAREARPGDCVMMRIGGSKIRVVNHAGVLIEKGVMLHHGTDWKAFNPARLSRRVPITDYLQYVTNWVRILEPAS